MDRDTVSSMYDSGLPKATFVFHWGPKLKKKCVKLNDYTTIIIEISHDRYFFAWFPLYIEKEPDKDKIDEEYLLPISKNFIFGQ